MSENLVHTAIVDDCLILARRATGLHPAFTTVATNHAEIARLGGITRFGDRYNPDLLTDLRQHWPWEDDAATATRLAFVVGWLSHRAADRNFKQVFRRLDPQCPRKPTDCSVYHDVTVLREVYGLNRAPFDANLLAPGQDGTPLEGLTRTLMQRALIGLHTLTPGADGAEWIDGLVRKRTRFTVDLRRYAEAYHTPDPDRVQRFLTEPCFYDRDDAIIQMARAGADAGPCDPCIAAPPRSLYGAGLARAFHYITAASAYFAGTIERREMETRLDIGQPEVPLAAQASGST
jgi:hypothetical protein